MKKTILETQVVRQAMKEHKIVPLKADWTCQDEDITQWLVAPGAAGVSIW